MTAMTRMLASVTSVEEAGVALNCGVDIIDLKNPSAGVLGALSVETVTNIVNFVRGRCPVSATVGDLPMNRFILGGAIKNMIASEVDFVKVGVFPASNLRDCLAAISCYAKATRLVAVLFADRNPDFSLLTELSRMGFAGVMLDTADKANGSLVDHIDDTQLEDFISRGRILGLLCGLAGSLQIQHIPGLIKLTPDYLGFRGALCEHKNRTAEICPKRTSQIRQEIFAHQPSLAQSIAVSL
jgi:dihydroneopterin aldolase